MRCSQISQKRRFPMLYRSSRKSRSYVTLALVMALIVVLSPSTTRATGIQGFTEVVSPPDETNATEPSVAVDRSDGTIYVAWQASGTHVARSDNGGRSF